MMSINFEDITKYRYKQPIIYEIPHTHRILIAVKISTSKKIKLVMTKAKMNKMHECVLQSVCKGSVYWTLTLSLALAICVRAPIATGKS